eukprot:TRINITY_DN60900_c0_g1_i2.p1 TRINITY_DN60900_c0_g1~~TRINITY_DN60900_c0_g1_i2.p1  ORF type:complete len:309 (+),score=38.49 TRINITY_DN60900_c0_g1_i2:76-1002(+)
MSPPKAKLKEEIKEEIEEKFEVVPMRSAEVQKSSRSARRAKREKKRDVEFADMDALQSSEDDDDEAYAPTARPGRRKRYDSDEEVTEETLPQPKRRGRPPGKTGRGRGGRAPKDTPTAYPTAVIDAGYGATAYQVNYMDPKKALNIDMYEGVPTDDLPFNCRDDVYHNALQRYLFGSPEHQLKPYKRPATTLPVFDDKHPPEPLEGFPINLPAVEPKQDQPMTEDKPTTGATTMNIPSWPACPLRLITGQADTKLGDRMESEEGHSNSVKVFLRMASVDPLDEETKINPTLRFLTNELFRYRQLKGLI